MRTALQHQQLLVLGHLMMSGLRPLDLGMIMCTPISQAT